VTQSSLVTTIIPVFNRAALLRDAVASVLEQTWKPLEIIVVDDGSTDDTSATAIELSGQHQEIQYLRIENSGPGAAREAGRRVARGEFIQYLDSDDVLLPEKFALQVRALHARPECGVAYGWSRVQGEPGRTERPIKRTGERIETMFPAMLHSRWWDTSTPLYRASLLGRVGPWSSLRMEEDWEYDCRVASLGVKLAYVEDWVSETRYMPGSLSAGDNGLSRANLRDRAAAHLLILDHARSAGIDRSAPEMAHYSRELFLLARQCGAAGLAAEAQRLFVASRASSQHPDSADYKAFAFGANVLGWRTAGRLSQWVDRWR
jgi:glycosyltransferase involved in cell wall biosynthesis